MSPPTSSAAVAQRLRIFYGRLRRRLQDVSAVSGLTAPQASALARLALNEPSSASQLAGAERVRPQSMAKTLTALHELGLVRREADPDDARQKWLFLTDDGRAAAQGARTHREEWLVDAFAQRFTDAERQVIGEALTLLERIVDQ
ncbi:MarR family winged helix-turn-helix transcriptional regulator [Cryptosporangium sp. NPDC051539]|uniref:MarR family winged helix-turn-helix transcriptional regulator n=1 Tax=Cryptosporangium sp. NPDC051539 TaxID=3363962 RepID=UPI0037ABDCFB